MEIIVRDLRKKDQYKIDDAYLNGYARLCGVYATAVYNSLSRHADFHTQECFPSMDRIAEQHGISKPSVIKGVAELVKWGIVLVQKGKDTKTKRQLSNMYILVDKSQWKPKTSDSRVNDIDSVLLKSRVNDIREPSQSQSKSRVNEVYCKDTHIKDTHIRLAEASIGGQSTDSISEVRLSQVKLENSKTKVLQGTDWRMLIDLFQEVNPMYLEFYKNISERNALESLAETLGVEKLKNIIKHLPEIISQPYAPKITKPTELKKGLGKLIAFHNQELQKRISNERQIII